MKQIPLKRNALTANPLSVVCSKMSTHDRVDIFYFYTLANYKTFYVQEKKHICRYAFLLIFLHMFHFC